MGKRLTIQVGGHNHDSDKLKSNKKERGCRKVVQSYIIRHVSVDGKWSKYFAPLGTRRARIVGPGVGEVRVLPVISMDSLEPIK